MSDVFTAAGTEIHIGAAAPATFDKAGYEAVTWTKIGETSNIPQFGKLFNLVTFNPLGQRGTIKRKGSFNLGSTEIEYGYDRDESGQVEVVAAAESDSTFPFRVVLQDGTNIYFMALVMGVPVNIGTIDNIVMQSAPLELDSESDILFEDAPL